MSVKPIFIVELRLHGEGIEPDRWEQMDEAGYMSSGEEADGWASGWAGANGYTIKDLRVIRYDRTGKWETPIICFICCDDVPEDKMFFWPIEGEDRTLCETCHALRGLP